MLGEQVACVCDPDPARRAWAAGLTGAEAFADWESLLERGEPEAVLVLTPPRLHREVTVESLERGLPVYLEKPVARDLADAQVIVAAAERTGVVCAIGYQWRAITWVPPAARAVRRARRSGCWPCACSDRRPAAPGSPTRQRAAARCSSAQATASISYRPSPGRR